MVVFGTEYRNYLWHIQKLQIGLWYELNMLSLHILHHKSTTLLFWFCLQLFGISVALTEHLLPTREQYFISIQMLFAIRHEYWESIHPIRESNIHSDVFLFCREINTSFRCSAFVFRAMGFLHFLIPKNNPEHVDYVYESEYNVGSSRKYFMAYFSLHSHRLTDTIMKLNCWTPLEITCSPTMRNEESITF